MWEFISSDQFWRMAWRLAVLLLLVLGMISVVWVIYNWQITTEDVAKGDFVRGLITVLILCGILALVAIVVLTALFAESTPPSPDESTLKRVTAVREVLAPLFGIFGTIIGFYFGSQTAERAQQVERARTELTKPALPETSPMDAPGAGLAGENQKAKGQPEATKKAEAPKPAMP
jgi:hypothetical protein